MFDKYNRIAGKRGAGTRIRNGVRDIDKNKKAAAECGQPKNKSEYFHIGETLQTPFYRVPKESFTDERYAGLSTDAKLLYGILIDRMELSAHNGWQDEQGRVYLYYTIEHVCSLLGFGRDKIRKLFRELENIDLIDRTQQRLGQAYMIYVKRFCDSHDGKSAVVMTEKTTRTQRKNMHDHDGKTDTNHTEYNHTEISDTESSFIDDADLLIKKLKYQIEYDVLLERMEKHRLDEILGLIADLMCIQSPVIKIGRYDYPQSAVYARMKQIRAEHIEFALERLSETKGQIHDIKSYFTTLLFYAPITMENHIRAEVYRDFGWQ